MAAKGKGAAEGVPDGKGSDRVAPARMGLSPGVLVLGMAMLFIATMGSAFLAVTFLGRTNAKAPANQTSGPAAPKKETKELGPTYAVGNFTVNLSDEGDRLYVKAGVAVEASSQEVVAELTARDPQLKDIVIAVLSSRTMADIASAEGKESVKREIRDAMNRLLAKGKVRGVFFTEFVFQ